MDLDDDKAAALLKRIASKDEKALRELHDVMARPLYAFTMNRLHDSDSAQEVLSKTLMVIWTKPAAFRAESRFTTWVFGIARNLISRELRDGGLPSADPPGPPPEPPPDPFADPDDPDKPTHARAVRECMKTLPIAQRDCLQLVFDADMSLAEVAALQGVPLNTVKTRLFHAREKMRACLTKVLGLEDGHHG